MFQAMVTAYQVIFTSDLGLEVALPTRLSFHEHATWLLVQLMINNIHSHTILTNYVKIRTRKKEMIIKKNKSYFPIFCLLF